ncbi:glycosyltransferase family 4 protein [Phormidesmis sp. 146-33]
MTVDTTTLERENTVNEAARLLLVALEWSPNIAGGLNRYVYELVQQLAAKNDQVELCGLELPATLTNSSIMMTNLAVSKQPLLHRLWSARQQFSQRSLHRPHAINLHFALYSFPILEKLPKDVPVTFTFHGPWAMESAQQQNLKYYFQCWLEQQVYNRSDRFIVLSKAFGQLLHETYRVPWEKIHIIPGGVNTTTFQPNLSRQAARAKLNWHPDRKILFTPRRLVQRMGLPQLLKAMVRVKQAVPEVWLAIAGKGHLRDPLEQQVQALGLSNHVQLLGYIPDDLLPIAYQAADLTVVPSQSLEGFGLILVESLACGTPAMCTPVGGMPEVLAPLSPDLVTLTPEADEIADHIIDLLTGALSLPTREECREYACNRFDWQTIAPQVRTVLLS